VKQRTWQKHGLALVAILGMALLGAVGAQRLAARSGTWTPRELHVSSEILGGSQACQTFVARWPGLDTLRVLLATYGRDNRGMLILHLRDAPNAEQDLATLFVDASEVTDNVFHEFTFAPIDDSQGRPLSFCVEFPLGTKDNALGVWGATMDDYPDGEASFQGIDPGRVSDLVFELDYAFIFPQTLFAAVDRLAADKPLWWGHSEFYWALGGVYLALVYVLVFALAQRDEERSE
jgi:hypothetical protein